MTRPPVEIRVLTDPMMGLSYESEPFLRWVGTHYPGQVRLSSVMGLLVRDVEDFFDAEERRLEPEAAIERYNARLAGIYRAEEPISGLPINMDGFSLFSPHHRSSLPLNEAVKAVELVAPEHVEEFLYRLRLATVALTRPTTQPEEILAVVRATGVSTVAFTEAMASGAARAGRAHDLALVDRLGAHHLPAYLITVNGRTQLARGVLGPQDFARMISVLSGRQLRPQAPDPTALLPLITHRRLISLTEIRYAFDLPDLEAAQEMVEPLLSDGVVQLVRVPRGELVELVACTVRRHDA